MMNIVWHPTKKKIVTQMDWIGAAVLALYIAFELSRNWIFGHWLEGAVLSAFTLTMLWGALVGRIMSMGSGVRALLEGKK